jgi:hypothetical protein
MYFQVKKSKLDPGTSGTRPDTRMTVLPPSFVNPCSYTSLVTVLRDVGKHGGVATYGTGDHQWLIVVCDGLPCTLASRIIADSETCSICSTVIMNPKERVQHNNQVREKTSIAERTTNQGYTPIGVVRQLQYTGNERYTSSIGSVNCCMRYD